MYQRYEQKAVTIAGAVGLLQRSTKRLKAMAGSSCGPDCAGCAPCRKAATPERCQALLKDIRDGNISRWRARKALADATRQLEAQARVFAARHRLDLAQDILSTGFDIVGALAKPDPLSVAMAANSLVGLVGKLRNYNGELAAEFRRFIEPYLRNAERAKDDAVYLDEIFDRQVKAYEREGCTGQMVLSSSDFNQPGNLRF